VWQTPVRRKIQQGDIPVTIPQKKDKKKAHLTGGNNRRYQKGGNVSARDKPKNDGGLRANPVRKTPNRRDHPKRGVKPGKDCQVI